MLLRIAVCLALCAVISPAVSWAEPPEGYKLVWADEFNEDGPPSDDDWRHERGLVRNFEAQWYQPQNATCNDGLLVIEARKEDVANPKYELGSSDWRRVDPVVHYTSSSIQTSGLHEWQYGVFEIRARIDARPGLWPAIWTLGRRGGWPGGGEIDIMEYYDHSILANACWQGKKRYQQKWDEVTVPLKEFDDGWAKEFHIWRMDWNAERIILSVDDRELNTIDLAEVDRTMGTRNNPFRQPHYLLLNLAVGGTRGGDPSDTKMPGRYEVDYVRVYQRADESERRGSENSGR
ncbi:glycoside hydrolase family 16 protein [Aeoliella sp. ICT_H6.2]|uniref:Glycoside hydrolase family 16 protein n=1 Tax=Aeoliella straminimaris TaxID=2954799 RepID=A0A9X2JIB9_9BACT|nr:glycoside hydrolase family 16 protein [Aeoliella straminimaris]MCO6046915.1 glycoside hydrolase family 16 protein [Aeoliella straminimaris]